MKNLLNKLAILTIGMVIGVILLSTFKSIPIVQESNTYTNVEQTTTNPVVVTKYLTVDTVKSEDNIQLDNGDNYFEMNDGSWYLYNEAKNLYIFQPVNLGDWDYHVNSMEELDNIVNTYFGTCNEGSF